MGSLRLALLPCFHVFGLWGFAIAQPIFALLVAHPPFLAAHRVGPADIVGLVASLSFVAPAIVALPIVLESILRRRNHNLDDTPRWAPGGLVLVLSSLLALGLANRAAAGPAWIVLALGVALGGVSAFLYARYPVVRTFATYLSLAAFAFPLLFICDARIREFLRPAPPLTADVDVEAPPPVVIVVLDELPLGALLDESLDIEASRFPNFAALAERSHWYRNATTVGSHTDIAVPALLTGLRPLPRESVPATLQHHPRNLFTLLARQYAIFARQDVTDLVPPGVGAYAPAPAFGTLVSDVAVLTAHMVVPAAWRRWLPPLQGWADFGGLGGGGSSRDEDRDPGGGRPRGRLGSARAFLQELAPVEKPPLAYLHVRLPHFPWEYLPNGQTYFDSVVVPGLESGSAWGDDAWLVVQGYQRFVVQLQAVDLLLGEVLARLDELGWLDEAVLVVAADHGTAFEPGMRRRTLDPQQRELIAVSLAPVPLFIKLPGQRAGAIHDEPVELIDVLPTLADVLDVELPWKVDGASLLSGSERRPKRRLQLYDPYVEVEIAGVRSALTEWVRRQRSHFGRDGSGRIDFFRLGRWSHLVGEPVPENGVFQQGARVILRRSNLFSDLDPTALQIPALIRGEIEGLLPDEGEARPALAIAINGVVRATTRASTSTGARQFSALVPTTSFRAGHNLVEVFRVEAEGAWRLSRLEMEGRQELLASRFASSQRTLLALGNGDWSALRATAGTQLRTLPNGALEVRATGRVPVVETAVTSPLASSRIVALELEVDEETAPILRFQTRGDPVFRPFRYARAVASRGRSEAFLLISDPAATGSLRIDLGRVERVILHRLEVRGIDS